MTLNGHTILIFIALICFVGAMFNRPVGEYYRFLAAGLFFWLLSTIVTGG